MNPSADQRLLRALTALTEAFSELESPGMVIGGIAVIAHGLPRQTVDIDATVWAGEVPLERLFTTFAAHELVPRIPDAEKFAQRRQLLLLVHTPTNTPLDVSLAWLPFEREALERASWLDFGGARIRVARPEDLLVYKAAAWRERDKSDIGRLLVLHDDDIDLDRVRDLVRQFAEALDEPERVEEFERIVTRTLGDTGG